MSGGEADRNLLRLVVAEEERLGSPLPIDTLIALCQLRNDRRIDLPTLAAAIQRDESAARNVLERLVEAGLVEAHGIKKGRTYTLSPRVYREMGQPEEYVRQVAFDIIQQEQMIRQYVRQNGTIVRGVAMSLCRISPQQASRLLGRMTREGVLVKRGERKATFYEPGPNI